MNKNSTTNTIMGKTYRKIPSYVCGTCKKRIEFKKSNNKKFGICNCEPKNQWYKSDIGSSICIEKVDDGSNISYLSTMGHETRFIKKRRIRTIRRKSNIISKEICKKYVDGYNTDYLYPKYANNIYWELF